MNSAPGTGLEDRLRSLILSNSESDSRQQPLNNGSLPAKDASFDSGSTSYAPPMLDASTGVHGGAPLPNPPKSSRRRPNQAQRRQMSAQLSIPTDHRPPPPHSARQYVSPPAYGNSHYPASNQNIEGPHSATFRPTHHTHASSNTPLPGGPFPGQPRHHQSRSYHGPMPHNDQQDWRLHQYSRPGSFSQNSHQVPGLPFEAPSPRTPRAGHGVLFNPGNHGRPFHMKPEDMTLQVALLDDLCKDIIVNAEIDDGDIRMKENFRARIEHICQEAIAQFEQDSNGLTGFPPVSVQLKCFGSLSSGFATKAADMDLALLSPLSKHQPDSPDSPIPRLVERAFLDAGFGARLLTRTRVPIIKLCESPSAKLRQDLVEERVKWELGIPADRDGPDADDELNEENEADGINETNLPGESQQSHRHQDSMHGPELSLDRYSQRLAQLRQGEKQHLVNYYATTKRLLRRLGGRDISHGTASAFKEADFKILADVCLAFVRGLANDELKTRLMNHLSLASVAGADTPVRRSLAGVYTQIEGEQMAMMWERREVHEKDEYHEHTARVRIGLWNEIQNKPNFDLDPLAYNKELQSGMEYLRKVPSIQVMVLDQSQFESPMQYHRRAVNLLVELGSGDTPSAENKILSVILQYYASGIRNEDIRARVQAFVASESGLSLRAIARRHKSLQLAWEYEKALDKSLYDESAVGDIKAYVELLRSPLSKTKTPSHHFDFVIPKTKAMASLVNRVRMLPDPSKLAPNQPRDPYRDRLEFPQTGAGVQCDINFSAHLALQNTILLRCYSLTDARVRPMVLFIKHWAKVREINTPYRGTLSSYGYVLMVLHYLVNVAQPFVCPNLQLLSRPPPQGAPDVSTGQEDETIVCKGMNVQFWRDEEEIARLAMQGHLNENHDSIGHLLRGFFEYYAQSHFMSAVPGRGFDWGRDVLSLRTLGGCISKQVKGWTGAKTVLEVQPPTLTAAAVAAASQEPAQSPTGGDSQRPAADAKTMGGAKPSPAPKGPEVKEVRHRYLFAIEDPFELNHNVARTVTHNGIVAIRDEFRRAWRIIKNAGRGGVPTEQLLQETTGDESKAAELVQFAALVDEIHSQDVFVD